MVPRVVLIVPWTLPCLLAVVVLTCVFAGLCSVQSVLLLGWIRPLLTQSPSAWLTLGGRPLVVAVVVGVVVKLIRWLGRVWAGVVSLGCRHVVTLVWLFLCLKLSLSALLKGVVVLSRPVLPT